MAISWTEVLAAGVAGGLLAVIRILMNKDSTPAKQCPECRAALPKYFPKTKFLRREWR